MAGGTVPPLDSSLYQELLRRVRMHGGRPMEQPHEPRMVDYPEKAGGPLRTTGCGKQRQIMVTYHPAHKRMADGSLEEDPNLVISGVFCADDDAMGRWPRWRKRPPA